MSTQESSMLALESQLDAQEEKIESLFSQIRDLTSSVNSMKEVLNDLPKSIERMMVGFQRPSYKQCVHDQEASETLIFRGPSVTGNYNPGEGFGGSGEKLLHRVGDTKPFESMESLKQEGDVEEYIANFKALSTSIANQSEEQLLGLFIASLQINIKNWVNMLRPTTCEKAIDLVRLVATAIGAPGERSSVKGKASNYNSGSNLNWRYGLLDLSNQSVEPNSQTTQPAQFDSKDGQLPLIPYDSPKLTVVHNHIVNTRLSKQEEEDDGSNLTSNSSYIVKTPTPNSESIFKTCHHDLQDNRLCRTKNLKEELRAPTIDLRSIDRLTQFYKPTCKMKALASVENFDLNNTVHELLSESRCNHCSRSLGIIHYQALKIQMLFPTLRRHWDSAILLLPKHDSETGQTHRKDQSLMAGNSEIPNMVVSVLFVSSLEVKETLHYFSNMLTCSDLLSKQTVLSDLLKSFQPKQVPNISKNRYLSSITDIDCLFGGVYAFLEGVLDVAICLSVMLASEVVLKLEFIVVYLQKFLDKRVKLSKENTSKIPTIKRSLERLLLHVKALLHSSLCGCNFWKSNLRHKNFIGEVVHSQAYMDNTVGSNGEDLVNIVDKDETLRELKDSKGKRMKQWLIAWQQGQTEEATWDESLQTRNQFLTSGTSLFQDGGIDGEYDREHLGPNR